MKANELRIGNVIHRNGEPIQIVIEDLVWLHNKPKEFLSCHQYSPLTEEWLERFGFLNAGGVITGNNYHYGSGFKGEGDETTTGVISVHYTSKERFIVFRYERNDIGFYLRGINYVHQLQNAWHSLTGEELTLKETAKQ